MLLENLTPEEFEHKIIEDWGEYFKSKSEDFETKGTRFIKRDNYAENRVIIAHVNQKTFVQYSPDIHDNIDEIAENCPRDIALIADHFISYFENSRVQIECLDDMFYLYPGNLQLFTPNDKFTIRALSEADKDALDELNDSCTEEEVDNSFVGVDELGAWGCFYEDKLCAAAGFSDWGLYADFGVISHPKFRRLGLAKAVVSAACQNAIEIGKIPIYRCHITLFSSINTASAVGFKKYPRAYYKMEVLQFQNPR